MAHPLDRVLGSVVIDKLEADYQRVSSAKYFAAVHDQAQAANDSARIRQLEKEVSKLREERDILRKAAKYFAEETHW